MVFEQKPLFGKTMQNTAWQQKIIILWKTHCLQMSGFVESLCFFTLKLTATIRNWENSFFSSFKGIDCPFSARDECQALKHFNLADEHAFDPGLNHNFFPTFCTCTFILHKSAKIALFMLIKHTKWKKNTESCLKLALSSIELKVWPS